MFIQKVFSLNVYSAFIHCSLCQKYHTQTHTEHFSNSVTDINVKLSDHCGIYLSYADINVYKQMVFVCNRVCNETEMIHDLILSVTVFRFVILITTELLCSEFFCFKCLLSHKKNLLYKILSVILLFFDMPLYVVILETHVVFL